MAFTARCFGACVAAIGLVIATLGHSQAQSPPSAPPPPGTSPQELGLAELTDDPQPEQLFARVIAAAAKEDPAGAQESAQNFSLLGKFRFPQDTLVDRALNVDRKGSLFGIDISHWTPVTFPIERLGDRHVKFLYMKTTQATGVDGSFARFWQRAGSLAGPSRIHRGAYHFLTCGDPSIAGVDWGKRQASAFLKVIRANGGLRSTDMPPVLDLEWDVTSTNPDRWSCRSPDEILATVRAFLTDVKDGLHRTPVIYTARAWWRERMGAETGFSSLAGYPVWLADYSKTSQASENPPGINGQKAALWQFTERAVMADGVGGGFDANIFKGDPGDLERHFLTVFELEKFDGETFE